MAFKRSMAVFARYLPETGLLFLIVASLLWKGGKTLEMTWALAGLAVLVTLLFWWQRRRSHQLESGRVPEWLWITGILFVAWTVLSYVTSSTQNYGLDEVLRDASLMLLFWWTIRTVGQKEDGRRLVDRFVIAVSVAALIACGFGLAVYVLQPVNRFTGTFFDPRFHVDYWPNAWAQFVLLAWPVVWLWVRRSPLALRIPVLGAVVGCLLLSYSRGGFLAFLGQLALWGLLLAIDAVARRKKERWQTGRMIIGLIGTAVVAGLVFAGANALRSQLYTVQSVSEKATFTAAEGNSSVSERRQFWEQAFQLSMERPMVGWGPYSFRFIQPRLQQEVFATSDHPHNVFLKLAMERGWPAAVLFAVLVLGVTLGWIYRFVIKNQTIDRLHIPFLIGVLGVIAHNMIDYNLQFVGNTLPFWIALGILSWEASPKPRILNTKVVLIAEVLIAMTIGLVAVREGRYLVISSLGRHEEAAGRHLLAIDWYRQAEKEWFSRDMHLSRAALEMSTGTIALDIPDATLDLYEEQNAEDARLWKLRGDIAWAGGDFPVALEYYERTLQLGQYNYLGALEGYVTMLLYTDTDQSILDERREEIESVYRAFGDAILRNAHFIALSQNVEEFESVSELLAQAYPDGAAANRSLAAKVVEHARMERERLGNQQSGFLW